MTDVKKNESKKTSAAEELERVLNEDELLADMPALREPHRLRLRHRNRFMRLLIQAEADGIIGADADEMADPEKMAKILDLLTEIDEFAQSIAVDQQAYEEWSIKHASDYEVFMAILSRYASAVGESNGS